jgi:hypothetical protein
MFFCLISTPDDQGHGYLEPDNCQPGLTEPF